MAAVDAIVDVACEVKPDEATLVPERREELTTEGGLDVVAHQPAVAKAVTSLQAAGIRVALFIDPDLRQIPVVVLTTSREEEDILKSYDLGANSFVTKPVGFDSLAQIVSTITQYWFQVVELPREPHHV